jgi:hypothetical protein
MAVSSSADQTPVSSAFANGSKESKESKAAAAKAPVAEAKSEPAVDLNEPPEGFEVAGGDLAGYWESAAEESRQSEAKPGSPAVLFTPLFVTLSDSKLEKIKSSTLLHARLEAPCVLRSADESEGYKEFPKGTLFGIWTKPGMKPVASLGGAVVWMKNNGFKDVGKQSKMALYDIRNKGGGSKLKVREDRRDHSLPSQLREQRAQLAADLSDIPF